MTLSHMSLLEFKEYVYLLLKHKWGETDFCLYWHQGVNNVNIIPESIFNTQVQAYQQMGFSVARVRDVEFYGIKLRLLYYNFSDKMSIDPLAYIFSKEIERAIVYVIKLSS